MKLPICQMISQSLKQSIKFAFDPLALKFLGYLLILSLPSALFLKTIDIQIQQSELYYSSISIFNILYFLLNIIFGPTILRYLILKQQPKNFMGILPKFDKRDFMTWIINSYIVFLALIPISIAAIIIGIFYYYSLLPTILFYSLSSILVIPSLIFFFVKAAQLQLIPSYVACYSERESISVLRKASASVTANNITRITIIFFFLFITIAIINFGLAFVLKLILISTENNVKYFWPLIALIDTLSKYLQTIIYVTFAANIYLHFKPAFESSLTKKAETSALPNKLSI